MRSLEREISKICRKVVKSLLMQEARADRVTVSARNLDHYLGVRRFTYGLAEKNNQVGQVTGLAWTEVGGELLTIEAAVMPGKGNIQRTGSLGDVMKESVEAARSVVRARAARLGIKDDASRRRHPCARARRRDAQGRALARVSRMTTALVSALTGIPVRADVAMTGEITLRGEVLAIGGLKEKLLAAHRGGIKTVLIPEENVKDLTEIPDNIKNRLDIHPVKWIDQVLETRAGTQTRAAAGESRGGGDSRGGVHRGGERGQALISLVRTNGNAKCIPVFFVTCHACQNSCDVPGTRLT